MDDKSQAELDILLAVDRWAREVMRTDRSLDPLEQELLDAFMHYQRITRSNIDMPVQIPRPPNVPNDLFQEPDTKRYSDAPTVPSPPGGIPAVTDIEPMESGGPNPFEPIELDEEELKWNGTGKPKPE